MSENRRNKRKALRELDKAAKRFFDNREYTEENILEFTNRFVMQKKEKDND